MYKTLNAFMQDVGMGYVSLDPYTFAFVIVIPTNLEYSHYKVLLFW